MEMKDLFEIGVKFHGHKCPSMPLGLRGGLAAMEKLGVERASNRELFCLLENGPSHSMICFGDGVQIATGCTFGKGNIERLNYSKSAFTLIDVKNKKAVRVVLNPALQKTNLTSEYIKLRQRGIHPKDISPDMIDPIIDNILNQPEEALFKISEVFDYDFKSKKPVIEWYECESCGEIIFADRVKIKDGKKLCITCSGYKS